MKTFINFSNLHTNKWADEMLYRAKEMSPSGEVLNIAFPAVSPELTKAQVDEMADACMEKLLANNPAVVFCQGDFSLCFEVVARLKAAGVTAVTSCNQRIISNKDGKTISGFQFVQFREF